MSVTFVALRRGPESVSDDLGAPAVVVPRKTTLLAALTTIFPELVPIRLRKPSVPVSVTVAPSKIDTNGRPLPLENVSAVPVSAARMNEPANETLGATLVPVAPFAPLPVPNAAKIAAAVATALLKSRNGALPVLVSVAPSRMSIKFPLGEFSVAPPDALRNPLARVKEFGFCPASELIRSSDPPDPVPAVPAVPPVKLPPANWMNGTVAVLVTDPPSAIRKKWKNASTVVPLLENRGRASCWISCCA